MEKSETLARTQVQALMRSARRSEQIAAAWDARADWLNDHPDDAGIEDEGEALFMREEALKRLAVGRSYA